MIGITITGRRGALLDVNPEYCRIVGYAKDELIGKNFIDFTHPDDHDNNLRMRRLLDSGELQSYELEKRYVRKDGKVVWARAKTSALNSQLRVSAIEDITERKLAEEERNTTVAFLDLVTKQFDKHGLVRAAAEFFQQESGCQAVGIRMREGDDYPYYEARGFPEEFIRLENSLCERDFAGRVVRDCAGNPVLDCMCGNVICGRFDPSKPFFTSAGTFWSNSTTELLASTSEADRQARTRNRCNGKGYESVALIPLHVGEQRLGLLQLNDRRPNKFSQEFISLWERLTGHLSIALAKFQAEEAQRRLAAIVETSEDAIFSKSLDGTVLTWNASAEKILGYTAKEIIGKSIHLLLPPDRLAEEDEILNRIRRGESVKHFETVRVAKDGRHVDVSLTISPLRDGSGKLIGASKILRDITEKKRAEIALQDARARLSAVVESTEEMIWSVDRNYALVTFNAALQRFFAAHHGLAITPGMTPTQLGLSRQRAQWWTQAYVRCLNEGSYRIEYNAEGGNRILELGLHPIRQHGVVSEVSVFAKDITERKRTEAEKEELQAQLSQAQKMESIGRLAGGVAHDFNNLLMVIGSYTEMLSTDLPAHSPQRKKMDQIMKAVERATSLTRQMLAFSRKQVFTPVVLDPNAVVNDTTKLLRRLIGEDVELQLVLGASLWSTRADPDQLVQVLMNLCVNARDAMLHGGTLRIETRNVTVTDGREQENPPIPLGEYVKLAVSDTGVGIKEELLWQIFEPFFTTKEPGKGTGLGLSTVYGIVTQSGGHIRVSSELGRGSCFAIYMPRTAEVPSPEDATPEHKPLGGTETILVAEDEEGLRDALCSYLCGLGYNVISGGSGQEALMVASGRDIDLLITDVVMPKMSGRKLSEILSSAHAGMKTLFMSGYTDDAILRHGVEETRVSFLQKPFAINVLARKIRELLGRKV